MKIYYFSGTGNSLYAASKIARQFPQAELKSIANVRNDSEIHVFNEELIIVCPLYFYGIPHIVQEFISKLVLDECTFFSTIFTAEYPNGLAVTMLKDMCQKHKLRLDGCWYLQMPTNYVIKSKMLSSDSIEKVLQKAEAKIGKITKTISAHKVHFEHDSGLYSLIVSAKNHYENWKKAFLTFDGLFSSTEKCNGCKLCEKYCPVNNIVFKDKPIWNKKCEACLRCINICPQLAIQYNEITQGKTRYFNPKVSLRELKDYD